MYWQGHQIMIIELNNIPKAFPTLKISNIFMPSQFTFSILTCCCLKQAVVLELARGRQSFRNSVSKKFVLQKPHWQVQLYIVPLSTNLCHLRDPYQKCLFMWWYDWLIDRFSIIRFLKLSTQSSIVWALKLLLLEYLSSCMSTSHYDLHNEKIDPILILVP